MPDTPPPFLYYGLKSAFLGVKSCKKRVLKFKVNLQDHFLVFFL